MSLAIRLIPETLRSLSAGSIGAAYMGVGTALSKPIRIFFLQNLTNETLVFSFDGINDHVVLPENGYMLIDVTSNKTIPQGLFIAEGARVYAKQLSVAPVAGAVYLSMFYGTDN